MDSFHWMIGSNVFLVIYTESMKLSKLPPHWKIFVLFRKENWVVLKVKLLYVKQASL